jgi:hypothetical protein
MKIKQILLILLLQMSFTTFAQLVPIEYRDNQQILSGFGIKP